MSAAVGDIDKRNAASVSFFHDRAIRDSCSQDVAAGIGGADHDVRLLQALMDLFEGNRFPLKFFGQGERGAHKSGWSPGPAPPAGNEVLGGAVRTSPLRR